MRPLPSSGRRILRSARQAFTGTDLLVVLAALAVLGSLVTVPWVSARRTAHLAQCVANLQQISRAVLLYSDDHRKTLPGPAGAPSGDYWWWYKEQIKTYVPRVATSSTNANTFACPDDRGYSDPKPFWQNPRFDYGSYVFNGVSLPGTPNIADWPVASITEPRRTLLVMEWTAHAPLSWHRSRTGRRNLPFYRDAESVVGFVDGHVSLEKIYYDGFSAAYTRDPIAGYAYRYSGN